jgi:hypothetical protein
MTTKLDVMNAKLAPTERFWCLRKTLFNTFLGSRSKSWELGKRLDSLNKKN